MNFSNSSFLCLDIGTYGVRGLASRVQNGNIVDSAIYFTKTPDTVFALKKTIDELEQKLNTHFDSAFITGNFGAADFKIFSDTINWNYEHKISELDLRNQIAKITIPDDFYKMHIIPISYNTHNMKDIQSSPVGKITTQLKSIFSVISYEQERTQYITNVLRHAHIKPIGFLDPAFLQNAVYRKNDEKIMFMDLGAEYTTVSIWTKRGPLFFKKIKSGQHDITRGLASGLQVNSADADILKKEAADAIPRETQRFNPISSVNNFDFSEADVNDLFVPQLTDLMNNVMEESIRYIEQYKPEKIILSGGGCGIKNIDLFVGKLFNLPVELNENASVNALSEYVWQSWQPMREAYLQSHKKLTNFWKKISGLAHKKKVIKENRFIPILPSTLCFDMYKNSTYTLFASGGISMIHVDIMDGLYVNAIAGSIQELSDIRTKTKLHLHVHLMTVNPFVWSQKAINAGADTVIISVDTFGMQDAIDFIKKAGKRCGIALNPDTDPLVIKDFLSQIDEVMVMAVAPGAAGQKFNPDIIKTIKMLNYTRKKHKLKYLISVDGGINPETAKLGWDAGANLLISGSYLEKSPDFPLAVQKLLNH